MQPILISNVKNVHTGLFITEPLYLANGKISSLPPHIPENTIHIDGKGLWIAPGLIDVHIQGAGGCDVLDGSEQSIRTISKTLARFGVTSFLATSVFFCKGKNLHLSIAADLSNTDLPGASLSGIHLEGPFINPERCGGLSSTAICKPSDNCLKQVFDATRKCLRMMTIAPELNNTRYIINELVSRGIIASFGHSAATYEAAYDGIQSGISHATHLFNAMNGMHHRLPGPIPALAEQESLTVQLIADGVHISPPMLRTARRIFGPDRIVCITDGIQALGLDDGIYTYCGRSYISRNGAARYDDGTLIGTSLPLNQIVRRYREYTDCSLSEAISTASLNPAKTLGIADRKGTLSVGADADVILVDEELNVWLTIVKGRIVYQQTSVLT